MQLNTFAVLIFYKFISTVDAFKNQFCLRKMMIDWQPFLFTVSSWAVLLRFQASAFSASTLEQP